MLTVFFLQARGHYFAKLDPLEISNPLDNEGDKIETVSKLIQIRFNQIKSKL